MRKETDAHALTEGNDFKASLKLRKFSLKMMFLIEGSEVCLLTDDDDFLAQLNTRKSMKV